MARPEWLGTNYYAVLGVDVRADHAEIAHAYRLLARECHPDLHPGDDAAEERFRQITAAYDVVGDSARRVEYDCFRAASHVGSPRRGAVPDWNVGPVAPPRPEPAAAPRARIVWPSEFPPEDLVDHRPVVVTRRILGGLLILLVFVFAVAARFVYLPFF